MAHKQSPGYPSFPLEKAILLASQVFEKDRKNLIDREVAAQHMGYSGISGASDKALSTLAHFRLVEKSGKGQLKVTQTLVDILHPDSKEDKRVALKESGLAPAIFHEIYERFSDGAPSEGALKSWLTREGFFDRAINPVSKAYLETIQYLEQSKAFESGGNETGNAPESVKDTENTEQNQMDTHTERVNAAALAIAATDLNKINAQIMGDTVRISALLDRDGLEKLEKKIVALKDFLDD